MDGKNEEAKRLRALNVSVPDISRQTGLSAFAIYEATEGRDVAVRKIARLHYVRGTGWPWDSFASDPDIQCPPSGDRALDAARAIINFLRGTSLHNPVRDALDQLEAQERAQLVEIVTFLIRESNA